MEWTDRRVLVTGATGIVGSWLVKALVESGAHVVCLVRDADPLSELYRSGIVSQTHVVQGQLECFMTLRRALTEHRIEVVFHLGAQTIVTSALEFPLGTFEANIRGTYHLLEAARQAGQQFEAFIFASSDKAYGSVGERKYIESMPLSGRHPYDVSKSCGDMLSLTYGKTYGLPMGVARCGNIYGGGDLNWSRIVPGTIRQLLAGARPIIRSDGTLVRDYIYVEDVVEAYLVLAEHVLEGEVSNEAFNFSTESSTTVLEIVEMLQDVMGYSDIEPEILDEVDHEIEHQSLSASKARTELGWESDYSLRRGLEETVKWYEEFLDA